MTFLKTHFVTTIILLFFASPIMAGDFDWMNNLKIKAEADSSGYRMQLATRFHVGTAEVSAVIGNVGSPSDAYMVFRLGEMSHKPIQEVLHVYSGSKNRGWGVMAKQLGIKPGSSEFHSLKRGHDLYRNDKDAASMHAQKGNGKHNNNPGKNGKPKNK